MASSSSSFFTIKTQETSKMAEISYSFEWVLDNYSLWDKEPDSFHYSAEFKIQDTNWQLAAYLGGHAKKAPLAENHVALYLIAKKENQRAKFSFTLSAPADMPSDFKFHTKEHKEYQTFIKDKLFGFPTFFPSKNLLAHPWTVTNKVIFKADIVAIIREDELKTFYFAPHPSAEASLENQTGDITISVKSHPYKKYYVHRDIVINRIPHLRSYFSTSSHLEINERLEPLTFEQLFHYLYKGSIDLRLLTSHQINQLLLFCYVVRLDSLADKIENLIINLNLRSGRIVHLEMWRDILNLYNKHNNSQLISKYLVAICNTPVFLQVKEQISNISDLALRAKVWEIFRKIETDNLSASPKFGTTFSQYSSLSSLSGCGYSVTGATSSSSSSTIISASPSTTSSSFQISLPNATSALIPLPGSIDATILGKRKPLDLTASDLQSFEKKGRGSLFTLMTTEKRTFTLEDLNKFTIPELVAEVRNAGLHTSAKLKKSQIITKLLAHYKTMSSSSMTNPQVTTKTLSSASQSSSSNASTHFISTRLTSENEEEKTTNRNKLAALAAISLTSSISSNSLSLSSLPTDSKATDNTSLKHTLTHLITPPPATSTADYADDYDGELLNSSVPSVGNLATSIGPLSNGGSVSEFSDPLFPSPDWLTSLPAPSGSP